MTPHIHITAGLCIAAFFAMWFPVMTLFIIVQLLPTRR